MGDKNVIALLTSINGNLKKIVETSQTNGNQSKEEVSEKMAQSLNTGTVLNGDAVKPKAEQGKIGDIVISASTVASLKTLPTILFSFAKIKESDLDTFVATLEVIKDSLDGFSNIKSFEKTAAALAGLATISTLPGHFESFKKLKKSDIEKFADALDTIKTSMEGFSELKDLEKSSEAISRIATSMKVLDSINFAKISVSLVIADKLGFSTLVVSVIDGVVKGVKKASELSKDDISKLEHALKSVEVLNALVKSLGLVVISVAGLALVIKMAGAKEVMQATAISLGIMVALSGLAIGVAAITKNIQNSTKSIDHISGFILKLQGLVLTTLVVGAIASKAWPEIAKGFLATSLIIGGYTVVAALASTLSKFVASQKNSFDVIAKMAMWGMAMTLGTLLLGAIATQAWPAILVGFASVSGIILGYTAIAALISATAKLSKTFKKDVAAITFMAGAAMGLTLGTTLLGYVAELSWKQILFGFSATSAIIYGYTEIAVLASKSAKGIYTAAKDLMTIGAVVAGAEVLLLGAIGLGKLIETSSIGALAGAIAGIGAVIVAISGVAKLAQAHTKRLGAAHINFAIAASALASAELIVAAALGISRLVRDEKDAYKAAGILIATGIVTASLVKLLKIVETNRRTISVGAKTLLLVSGAALAAESIILGSVLIAKLAKKEDILPAAGVLLASGAVVQALITVIKHIEKNNTSIATGAKSLMMVAGVALAAEGIILGAIAIGKLVNKDPSVILSAATVLGAAGGVIYGLVQLVKTVEKHNKDLAKGAKSLLLVSAVAFAAEGIILGAIGLGHLFKKDPELIGYSTVALGMASTITLGLVGLVKLVEKHNKDLSKGSKNLLKVALVAAAAEGLVLGAIALAAVQKRGGVSTGEILEVIGVAGGIVTAFGGLAIVAGKMQSSIKKGIPGIALAEALALGATALVYGIVKLVEAKNNAKADWADIFITIGAMATVVTSFGALAAIAGTPVFTGLMVAGAAGLALAEALALGAALLIGGIVHLVAAKNKLQVEWSDVFTTIGAMATVVTAFGTLAAIAGVPIFTGLMLAGAAGLGAAEALALGGVGLVFSIVKLVEAKNKANVEWEEVYKTIDAMVSVVKRFEILAGISSFAMPFILLGTPGVAAAEALAIGATALVNDIVKFVEAKNKANVEWNDITMSIDSMTNVVKRFEVLAGIAGLAAPFILLGTPAMEAVTGLAIANIEVLNSLVRVTSSVKTLGPDGWDEIRKAISTMSRIITNTDDEPGFAELSKTAAKNVLSLRLGAGALKEVAVTSNIAALSLSQMSKTAADLKNVETEDITRIIVIFDSVVNKMYDMVGLKFLGKVATIKSAKTSINTIAGVASDISKAMSDIAMVAGPNGLVRSATITKTGGVVYGDWVDCSASAETLAGAMGSFVTILNTSFKEITKDSIDMIKSGMVMMGNIMSPVSVFAETLSSFEGKDGKIRMIKYDEDGKQIDTPYVDVRSVAQSIANSISTFCGVLFSAENQSIWKRMTTGGVNIRSGKEGEGDLYSPSATEAAMGIFATVVDPIGNFTSTLAMFSDGDGSTLIMPIYDGEGRLKGTRTIQVINAANTIGNAVTMFVKTLASQSKDWMDIYSSYESGGIETKNTGFLGLSRETVDTRKNVFADAMGVFSTVITPVISFANMLAMFEDGENGELITYDANTRKQKKINATKIATLIGSSVTSLVTLLGSTFEKQKENLVVISSNQQAIVDILNGMTNSISSIGDIDATNANGIITAYTLLLDKLISLSSTGDLSAISDAGTVLGTIRTNLESLGSNTVVKNMNSTVEIFDKMNTSLKKINERVETIDKLKVSIDSLSSSEGSASSFSKLSNSITSFFNIFKDPNFGDVSSVTNPIDKIFVHIQAAVTGEGAANAKLKKEGGITGLNDKLSDSFLAVRSSLQKFDKALDSGNEKRIKNIKSIAAAVKELNIESSTAKDNLNAIKDILNAIASLTAKSSSGELSQVVSSLNSISIGGSGGGGGTSKETIAEAVQYALDGLTINGAVPVVESIDKTGKATYKSNNVDFTIEVDEI